MRRVSFLVVVVALLGALVSACSGGGSVVGPSGPVDTRVVADPTKGDFQVINLQVLPPGGTTLHVGDGWSLFQNSYCSPGMLQGVVFVRSDGAILPNTQVMICEGPYFRETGISGRVNSRLADFAGTNTITMKFATADTSDNWFSGDVRIREGLTAGGVTVDWLIQP